MLVSRGPISGVVVNNRYEIKDILGQGGMGIVYRAYDLATKRDVALKTLRETDLAAVEMFSKEWTVLASISHPNIVDILDCGEFSENGHRKPFFVMPLLPGKTLDQLIRGSSQRLTVERTVEILVQTCRGLQAAHERGLIHRDLKPSNIFVMEDDTAKIIDFGVVHSAGSHSVTGLKGTLQYMAPEQLALKPCTPLSDIFSLGVVSYEALTGRKPFARKTDGETAEAVLKHLPPPASEVNPGVNDLIGRVVHKAMAKEPRHRFANAKELAETLQKAVRNQPIDKFDRSKIQPRVERAKKAFSEGDSQFAQDILNELEAEGNIDPEMAVLRLQIDQASRQRTIRQLLESAHIRLEQEEHPLALQKIQEVLQIDPDNPEALRMRQEIESQRSERQIDNWLRLAKEHLERGAFSEARQGLQEALKLKSDNSKVNQLLAELTRQEQESSEARSQKEKLYNSAKEAFQNGEISTALTKLERILALNRKTPDRTSPERDALYQTLYNQVRSEHDAIQIAYQEARRHLAEKDFAKALAICEEYQKKYPNQALFQALKLEVGEQERQEWSSYTADVARRLDAEPDLDRKLSIIKDAANRYPNEPQFQQTLKLIRERRDLVLSIVAKARQYEERGQFAEAINQWDILRSINPQYPALPFEIEQLQRRREQQSQEEAKSRWVEQIDRALEHGEFDRARGLALEGLAEYPGDGELAGLERLARQGIERNQEAQRLLEEGRQLCGAGTFDQGIETLRRAAELDQRSTVVRTALVSALVDRAQELMKDDWRAAEVLIQKALELDESHAFAKSLRSSVQDYRRKEAVTACLAEARELQVKGEIPAAVAAIEQCLKTFPNEGRLLQLRTTLQNSVSEAGRRKQRTEDLGEIRRISEEAQRATEVGSFDSLVDRSRAICARNGDDAEIRSVAERIEQRASFTKTSVFGPGESAIFNGPSVVQPNGPSIAPPPPPPPVKPTGGVPPVNVPPVKRTMRRLSPVQLGGLAAIPLLILGGWAVSRFSNHPPKPTSSAKPTPQRITASPKSPSLPVSLTPELQRLRLTTSLVSGKVLLDGDEAGELQGGTFSKDDVTLGEHTLQVMDGRRELLAVHFRGAMAAAAQVVPPLKTKDLLVVSSFADRVRVYSGPTALQVGLKDQPPQQVPPEGLELTIRQPANELIAINGKDQRALPIEPGNAPTLSIFLNDAADTRPVLRVVSNVDSPQLFLNGRPQKWRFYKSGFVQRLEPGKYSIKLSKQGYQDSAEQTVSLEQGKTEKLQFELKPLLVTASLLMEGGTPGAEVWVDGVSQGHLDGGGRLKLDLSPGERDIRLSKDQNEPSELGKRTLIAGQELRISGAEAKLKPFGALIFQVSTPGADIKFKREDESQWHSAKDKESVPVKEGRYQTLISADHYEPQEPKVPVEAGKPVNVPVTLVAKVEKKGEVSVHREQSLFLTPAAWEQDEDGFSVSKKGYGWISPASGSFKVDLLRKSRRFLSSGTIEWIIGYRDKGRSRVVYKLGSNGSLTRLVINEGKETESKLGRVSVGDAFHLEIVIEPHRILIRERGKGQVDDYPDSDADFTQGGFGFSKNVHLKIAR
ncbi:MAG: protein kinase domain-containing protein [Bryobacteraceae bacterium]